MLSIETTGSFKNTEKFLARMKKSQDLSRELEKYAKLGVQALSSSTPKDSGETAAAWHYEIVITKRSQSIIWTNSHVVKGANIAILLQYGHGTGTGGYIQGRDYINPAMKPIFDQIARDVRKAVTSA